jgi:hypothetical protein
MNEVMIERLKKLARSKCYYDEDEYKIIEDYARGNIDDAFFIGEHAGEVMLAREVLTALDIKWTEE